MSKGLSASAKSLSRSREWFIEVYIGNQYLIIIVYVIFCHFGLSNDIRFKRAPWNSAPLSSTIIISEVAVMKRQTEHFFKSKNVSNIKRVYCFYLSGVFKKYIFPLKTIVFVGKWFSGIINRFFVIFCHLAMLNNNRRVQSKKANNGWNISNTFCLETSDFQSSKPLA